MFISCIDLSDTKSELLLLSEVYFNIMAWIASLHFYPIQTPEIGSLEVKWYHIFNSSSRSCIIWQLKDCMCSNEYIEKMTVKNYSMW